MQLAVDSPESVSGSTPQPALSEGIGAKNISRRASGPGFNRQHQTTRGVTKLSSALRGAIPKVPVFVPAERLRKSSSQRSI